MGVLLRSVCRVPLSRCTTFSGNSASLIPEFSSQRKERREPGGTPDQVVVLSIETLQECDLLNKWMKPLMREFL